MKNRIKEMREAEGLSQAQLGKTVGCKQTVISKIEADKQEMTVEQLTQFASALNVHPADLISAKEWSSPHAAGVNAPLLRVIMRVLAKFLRKYPALHANDAANIMTSLYRQYALREPLTQANEKRFEADAELLIKHELTKRA